MDRIEDEPGFWTSGWLRAVKPWERCPGDPHAALPGKEDDQPPKRKREASVSDDEFGLYMEMAPEQGPEESLQDLPQKTFVNRLSLKKKKKQKFEKIVPPALPKLIADETFETKGFKPHHVKLRPFILEHFNMFVDETNDIKIDCRYCSEVYGNNFTVQQGIDHLQTEHTAAWPPGLPCPLPVEKCPLPLQPWVFDANPTDPEDLQAQRIHQRVYFHFTEDEHGLSCDHCGEIFRKGSTYVSLGWHLHSVHPKEIV